MGEIRTSIVRRDESGHWVVAAGCSMACPSCPRDEGRRGLPITEAVNHAFESGVPRRLTIGYGDVLRPELAPLAGRARDCGAEEILFYGHPGGANGDVLAILAKAGMTGLHVLVPGGDREMVARHTGGRGSVTGLARLLDAANRLELDVLLEVPVLPDGLGSLTDTVRRALARTVRPIEVRLPFRCESDGRKRMAWDFRDAAAPLADALAAIRERGIPAVIPARDGPPPCLVGLSGSDALAMEVPATPGQFVQQGLRACDSCELAGLCVADLRGFAPEVESPPVAPPVRQGWNGAVTSAERMFRRADIDALWREAQRLGRCPAPWDSLEAHDRSGRVTPCQGRWPLPEVAAACGSWRNGTLLEAWNAPGMQSMRRAHALGCADRTCTRDCPQRPRHGNLDTPLDLPRTRVFHDNLLESLREQVAGAEVLRALPRHLTISPGFRCNQQCRMCDLRDALPGVPEDCPAELPDAMLDEITSWLPTLRTLALTGGEPLLSRGGRALLSLLAGDRFPDADATVTTNGLLLDPSLIRELSAVRLKRVFVSLNAATAGMHETVTGTSGGFDKVLANVRNLMEASRHMPLRPEVVLSMVVMRTTLPELESFLDLAAGLGTGVRLLPIEGDRSDESLFTSPDRLHHALDAVRGVAARSNHRPPAIRNDLDALESRMQHRLSAGDFSPL